MTGKTTIAHAIKKALDDLGLPVDVADVKDDRDLSDASLEQRLASLAQSMGHRRLTIQISTEMRDRRTKRSAP